MTIPTCAAVSLPLLSSAMFLPKSLGPRATGPCAKRVFSLMIDYLLLNAARFYTDLLGQKDHVQHARWLANYILAQQKDGISARCWPNWRT